MIQLKISGRAGNQFFQYAFVNLYMKDKNIPEKLKISFEHFKKYDDSFKNELDSFTIDEYEKIDKIHYTLYQKILDFKFKFVTKIIRNKAKLEKRELNQNDYNILKKLQKQMNRNGLYYYIPGMDKFYKSKIDNIVFYGCYEDFSYYKNRKNVIKKLFTPKYSVIEKNIELYEKINSTNSICVTIRRGDFMNSINKNNYYICNPEYFKNAILEMNKLVKKPQYIVFSDDVEWCKNNMHFPKNTIYESGNDPIWEKIRLMYSCKHFIISNSTFSWWAQYLSNNKNKIVIAPQKWNNFEYSELIYDDKWILL